jgi:hypothetical protein
LIRTQAMERQPIRMLAMEAPWIIMPGTGTLRRRCTRQPPALQPFKVITPDMLSTARRARLGPTRDTAPEQVHEPLSRATRHMLGTLRHRTSTGTRRATQRIRLPRVRTTRSTARLRPTVPPASLHL